MGWRGWTPSSSLSTRLTPHARAQQSERLELSNTSRQRLVLLAAARQAGVTPEFMAAALQVRAPTHASLVTLHQEAGRQLSQRYKRVPCVLPAALHSPHTTHTQELATLLPDLASLLPSLSPAVLAPLAADTAAVAHKLVSECCQVSG
jgi:hypothetical protein